MTITEIFPALSSDFAIRIRSFVGQPIERLLDGLSAELGSVLSQYNLSNQDLLRESGNGYSRHLLHADEGGLFSIMLLVWRPGSFSPIHAHWTWCGYVVLDGELLEEHLKWDIDRKRAVVRARVERVPGQVVVSSPGLHDIHRLGNTGRKVAVSLHIYGVSGEATGTHVNRVLQGE